MHLLRPLALAVLLLAPVPLAAQQAGGLRDQFVQVPMPVPKRAEPSGDGAQTGADQTGTGPSEEPSATVRVIIPTRRTEADTDENAADGDTETAAVENRPVRPLRQRVDGTNSDNETGSDAAPTDGDGAENRDGEDDGAADGDGDGENTEEGSRKARWQSARARRFKSAPQTQGRLTFDTPAPIVPIQPVRTELKAGATLRQLDKMTGKIETFELAIGEDAQVARLRVRLDACRAPSDNGVNGTMAYLKVWDRKDQGVDAVFSGWMFAESPALSALDHPRYDVWVINCTTASDVASGGNE